MKQVLEHRQRVLYFGGGTDVFKLLSDWDDVLQEYDGYILFLLFNYFQQSKCKYFFEVLLANLCCNLGAEDDIDLPIEDRF